ncbi:L-threonylcarbamoyladenylate synthase [Streptococcus halichoeri]|uniref:L-threonylcarbamoyladenylate synthase n=1 Tax=Streptococcus halichoeri TaxID=254785 RepID=UPI00135696A0|nr:L-threonylcarbamoyladenylate synthase [Streptococcus halichoeri]
MIEALIQEIRAGGAVVLPTETVYGLFAKALDQDAVDRVYALKKRPRDKAMNLNVADYQSILAYSKEQPRGLKALYDAFLPGPLTIILKANEQVPPWINSGLASIGFRLPAHPVTRRIIQEVGPLIGPSANVSGTESGKQFSTILTSFDHKVIGYADDHALTGQDSTILDLSGPKAKILRQGAITQAAILEVVPDLVFEAKNHSL